MPVIARLVVISGGEGVLLLRAGAYTIGRDPASDLYLDDRKVSRRHASVVVDEQVVRIQDNRSCNGTYVNGSRVEQCALDHGAEVSLGGATCRLERHEVADDSTFVNSRKDLGRGSKITPAEKRVFDLVLSGHSEKEIARHLNISPHTVHNHIKRIYQAFHVHSRSELLASIFNRRNRNRDH